MGPRASTREGLKKSLQNTALVLGSLLLVFLIFELVVLRWIIPVTDIPRVRFADGLITYVPGQSGEFRIESERAASFRINREGWNSAHDHYPLEHPGRHRIVVIGDSYVAAFQVDYRESVAERLQQELAEQRPEVFRFGIGGAPLSQYLQVLRHVIPRYSPDTVIVVLAHNDFVPSYLDSGSNVPGRYAESFLRYELSPTLAVTEIPPAPFSCAKDWISQLASVRYLHYQHRLKSKLRALLNSDSPHYEANVDVDAIHAEIPSIQAVTQYTFEQLDLLTAAAAARLLIVMDGNRTLIHDGGNREDNAASGALILNRLASDIAREQGIEFLDLHPVFETDYRANTQKLNFDNDGHWNAYAHALVAKAIAAALRLNPEDI